MIPDKWIRTKSDEAAVDAGAVFDLKRADYVRNWIQDVCNLHLLTWQWENLIAPLYGWTNKDGSMRFMQASVWVPKSNGKSSLSAALSLLHLVGMKDPNALVVNMASDVKQADTCFQFAQNMIAGSKVLTALTSEARPKTTRLIVQDYIKTCKFGRSVYRIASGERGGGKRGAPISLLVYDELAEVKQRMVFDVQWQNVTKRPGILLTISTSGYNRESIAYEQFQYAEKVKSGTVIDKSFLPVVYAADPKEDWRTLDTFAKCNPSYPDLIQPRVVEALVQEAQNEPRKLNAYLTERLNLWVGAATQWIANDKWDACKEPFTEEDLYGLPAWVGIDYAWGSNGRADLAATCLVVEKEKKIYLLPRFFTPKIHAEAKEREDKVSYSSWVKNPACHLTFTDQDTIDYKAIRESLLADSKHFRFQEVAYDPTGLGETANICEQEYGWKMVNTPCKAKFLGQAAVWFEQRIMAGEIRHNNELLTWNMKNCATKETPDGLHVYKGSGYSQRIDGIIAALLGISRYLVREEPCDDYIIWV